MNNELRQTQEVVTKLRADLMATNQALLALASVLTLEQQRTALKALAQLSVMQEQTAEQVQVPEAIVLLQAAIQRQYTALSGVLKLSEASGH